MNADFADEIWIHYDTPKKRKTWGPRFRISTAKPNIPGNFNYVFGISKVYCIMSCSDQTNHYLDSPLHTINEIESEKTSPTYSRPDKIIFLSENDHQHVTALVKSCLKTFVLEVLCQFSYLPDIALGDYHLFRSITLDLPEQHFTSNEGTKDLVSYVLLLYFINSIKLEEKRLA